MKYNVSVKRYYNTADGVRFNVSFSLPQHRKSVWECPDRPSMGTGRPGRRVRPLEQRDESNVLRAIREIRNIGLSNDWDYFVTFTLDPEKMDRTDYATASKKMTQYFRNLRKEGYDIQYLLIPELHKDKHNWHFHGLISGVPPSMLSPHPLKSLAEKGYVDFPEFAKRFGYVSFSPVKQTNAVVYYCLKYVNKQMFHCRMNDGMRLYYVSRGISRPVEVIRYDNIDLHPGYVCNNYHSTDYLTGYARGLTLGQIHECEQDFLLNTDIIPINESEVFEQ